MKPELKKIVMWALTYRCNMACEYCFQRGLIKKWDEVTEDECYGIANKIATDSDWKPDAVWLTGGEPTVKKNLSQIINILQSNGIECVITTNGLCDGETLNKLISAKPKGINVSLESFDDAINSKNRGHTAKIIKSIEWISANKAKNTILGVSCVISPKAILNLIPFAKELKRIGVEYLSMNPLIGGGHCYSDEDFEKLRSARIKITDEIGLEIPSDFYFSLVEDCHLGKKNIHLKCPCGDNYFFIAPWGGMYPCSNEMWLKINETKVDLLLEENISSAMNKLRDVYRTDLLSTDSVCFGDRCVGCWKLYYDTIFTK